MKPPLTPDRGQFLIERPCSLDPTADALRAILPCVVWVYLEKERARPGIDYDDCGTLRHRLVPPIVATLADGSTYKLRQVESHYHPSVCEEMGHLGWEDVEAIVAKRMAASEWLRLPETAAKV